MNHSQESHHGEHCSHHKHQLSEVLTTVVSEDVGVVYTCPMHPQVRQKQPGSCPICGMALEPETVSLDEGPDPELIDMTRRFWVAAVLSFPLESEVNVIGLVTALYSNYLTIGE